MLIMRCESEWSPTAPSAGVRVVDAATAGHDAAGCSDRSAPVGVWPVRLRARPDASLRGLLQLRTTAVQLASTSFPSRPCVSSSGPEEKISSLVLAAFPLPKRKLHRPSM